MLLGGLLLENVPHSPIASVFPPEWGSHMRAAGLATIYLRCGLVLEWHVSGLAAHRAAGRLLWMVGCEGFVWGR